MKRVVFVGQVGIGGDYPVSVQSMTKTKTEDVTSTINQINVLRKAGCDIVRVAIAERSVLSSFKEILERSVLPVIADIHFDYYLALKVIEMGVDGIRINPANIGSKKNLKDILKMANQRKIPIRIGINAGSLAKKYLEKSRSVAEAMVASVVESLKFFEDSGFHLIKISLKASDVAETVRAYRLIDKKCDYPLHLGITETGTFFPGTIKSAVGIGSLLLDGIGNTIRVSLTDSPVREIKVAKEILKTVGLSKKGFEIISCPTCSRITVDLISYVKAIEQELEKIKPEKKIKVAIMGCEVNGPGEAREADIGLAFSKNRGFIFKKGKMVSRVKPEVSVDRLLKLIQDL